MTTYHLHARLHEGQLGAPDSRYLFQSKDTNDLDEATTVAKDLAGRGFEVVIYDHNHPSPITGASDYRQIMKFYPDGAVDTTTVP
ncbi:MAG: hypothetical protein JO100_10185 [Pseudonocardia sp.]|nr:hypothetical protein [Pseudonocardia sp.]